MPRAGRRLLRSFAGGEIAPELYGRIDLDKMQTGVAKAENFLILPHGPAECRPGLRYVRAVKNSAKRTKLLPFTYSADQSMVLEFGDGYIRFHTLGATLLSAGVPYEVATPYAEAHLFDLHITQSADVLTITHPSYAPRELRRLGALSWSLTTITFAPAISAPAAPTVAATYPTAGTPTPAPEDSFYVVTALSATLEESVASAAASANNELAIAGNYNSITPPVVAGVDRFNVYKRGNGGLYGYIGQSDGSAFKDTNITPDMSQSPPESANPFPGAGDWPSSATYVEQRRVFAATDNRPQTIWMTRSATESNMAQSTPLRDDDAIILTIKAMQQNRVRHVMPLGDLVALTAGGEFRVYAAGSDVLTPTTATPKPQSYVGASNVQPALAENAVLYAEASGAHVREFAYSGEGLNGSTYTSSDVCVLAPHLFDGYTVIDMAFSRTSGCPILWVVRSDGVLLGMTYLPGQNVRAWHRHTTAGVFESVCCVPEAAEDVLYAIVRRTINGATVRTIERLQSRRFDSQADAFRVDCGLSYSGAPATVISGLGHLEGMPVAVLADGAVVNGLTVASGAITLPVAASKVHVGLAYVCELQTLPVSWQADEALGQGSQKNVSQMHLRVNRAGALLIGPAGGRLTETKRRTTEPYGTAPSLRTGWDHTPVTPRWDDDAGILVRNENPLPATVLALVLDVTAGG